MTQEKIVACRDRHDEKHEIPAEELSFRPSAYGIFIRDNKILLNPQWDGYDFPGGGLEPHETIKSALSREFREETGLTILVEKFVHADQDFYYSLNEEKAYNSILLYYTCSYVSGEISDAGFDEHEKEYAKKAEWVPLSRIEDIKFYNSVDSVAVIHKALTTTH